MRTYWTLWFGVMSLLIANEARHSSVSMVSNEYLVVSYVFTVIGVSLLVFVVSKTLLLKVSGKHRA
jgi:hypothetical protein